MLDAVFERGKGNFICRNSQNMYTKFLRENKVKDISERRNIAPLKFCTWENQSVAAHCILHTVPINYITVLYESYSTVRHIIGQMQYSYADNWTNTV